ncbi:hypothetical protein Tco_0706137 [Tanacetum coccineum]|uniref:CCHC-type domain-containing protein n=1 Tax=Tanacetum coccineum TaxID=301880 RepID=A0ABQ4Y7H5_9ASTR
MTTTTTPVTNAQLKALIDQGIVDALAARDADRSMNGDDSYNSGMGVRRTERVARECTYPYFMKYQPLNFKGTEGVVELTQWFDKMETVFHLKKKTTDKYCPRGEIKKLKVEMWNLKVKGTDVIGYNQRFQELALMCVRMFPEESDKVEKYVGGLPDMIHGSTENKRKQDENNNQAQQQPPKKQGVAIAYTAETGERKDDDEASYMKIASETSAAQTTINNGEVPHTTAIIKIQTPNFEERSIMYMGYGDGAFTLKTEQTKFKLLNKARNANMFADGPCPRNNLRRFIGMDDAKEIWEAIKTSNSIRKSKRVRVDGKAPVGFDKKKLECFNCHNTGHFSRECTAKGTHDGKKKRDSFYQHQEAGKQEKN